jgi:hypothetical protein
LEPDNSFAAIDPCFASNTELCPDYGQRMFYFRANTIGVRNVGQLMECLHGLMQWSGATGEHKWPRLMIALGKSPDSQISELSSARAFHMKRVTLHAPPPTFSVCRHVVIVLSRDARREDFAFMMAQFVIDYAFAGPITFAIEPMTADDELRNEMRSHWEQ